MLALKCCALPTSIEALVLVSFCGTGSLAVVGAVWASAHATMVGLPIVVVPPPWPHCECRSDCTLWARNVSSDTYQGDTRTGLGHPLPLHGFDIASAASAEWAWETCSCASGRDTAVC